MQNTDTQSSRLTRQKRGIWITVASILVVIIVFFGLFLHKILSPRILSDAELRANGAFVFEQPRLIGEFQLVDHDGEAFTLADLKGQWTIAFFGFTHCPDICPTTLVTLNRMMDSLDESVRERTQVIMVSVDPARDTPEHLAEYMSYFNSEFTGVTGEFLEIMRLTRQLGVAFNKVALDDDYTVDHTSNLALINPEGQYQAFYRPPFEAARLKLVHQSVVSSHRGKL